MAVHSVSSHQERHGLRYTPEYSVWSAIITRCYNPNYKQAKDYSERNITMCDEWRESFQAFYDDMGLRPGAKYSIERIDNEKGYEPTNCRWATSAEQNYNKRNNVLLEFRGRQQFATQWAKELGMKKTTLFMRLRRGWPTDKALTQPLRTRN